MLNIEHIFNLKRGWYIIYKSNRITSSSSKYLYCLLADYDDLSCHDSVNNENKNQSYFFGKTWTKEKHSFLSLYFTQNIKKRTHFLLFLYECVWPFNLWFHWFLLGHVYPHVFMSLIQPKTCYCFAVYICVPYLQSCHCNNNAFIASSCHLCETLPSFQQSIPHSCFIAILAANTCIHKIIITMFFKQKSLSFLCYTI